MNFYDKIQELDYTVRTKNEHCIIIEQKETISDIVMIFDLDNRTVSGYLKPNDIIKDVNEIAHQYQVFLRMKKDEKEFAKLSKYAIL